MSTASCRPTGAAPSRPGSPRIPTMPRASPPGARRPMLIRARYGAVAERAGSRALRSRPARAQPARLARCRGGGIVAAFLIGGAVGWMARGASAAAPSGFELFTAEALEAYKLYVVEVRHPVEVPGERARASGAMAVEAARHAAARARISTAIGLKLVGGRLLPGPTGAGGVLHVRGRLGRALHALLRAHAALRRRRCATPPAGRGAAFYWVDRGLAYVVSGPADRDRLHQIAQAAYDQIDTRTAPKGG